MLGFFARHTEGFFVMHDLAVAANLLFEGSVAVGKRRHSRKSFLFRIEKYYLHYNGDVTRMQAFLACKSEFMGDKAFP